MPECLDRLAVEGEPARHDPGIDLTIRVAGVGCQKIALIGDQGSGEGWVYCTTLGRLGGRERASNVCTSNWIRLTGWRAIHSGVTRK